MRVQVGHGFVASRLINLKRLAHLRSLDLTGAQLHHAVINPMEYLPSNLEELCLEGLHGPLPHFKVLTNLTRLKLSGRAVDDQDYFGQLKLLNKLIDVEAAGIFTDAGLEFLKGLKKLERLTLKCDQITDAGLDHLAGLSALRELQPSGAKLTAEGVSRLQQALPKCTIRRK